MMAFPNSGGKIVDRHVRDLFNTGQFEGQEPATKMEQRFRPGTVGNSLYGRNRSLSAAEREGLIPVQGTTRRASFRKQEA